MKLVKSEYVFDVQANDDESYPDTIKLEINDEFKQHIKITYFNERRRTKEEFIKLYKWIIEELEKLD